MGAYSRLGNLLIGHLLTFSALRLGAYSNKYGNCFGQIQYRSQLSKQCREDN